MFQVDIRPKAILVTGSEDVPEAVDVVVFRNTERVVKVEDGLLIELLSRRATNSAMRSTGPLKRGFGTDARAQIILHSRPKSSGE